MPEGEGPNEEEMEGASEASDSSEKSEPQGTLEKEPREELRQLRPLDVPISIVNGIGGEFVDPGYYLIRQEIYLDGSGGVDLMSNYEFDPYLLKSVLREGDRVDIPRASGIKVFTLPKILSI